MDLVVDFVVYRGKCTVIEILVVFRVDNSLYMCRGKYPISRFAIFLIQFIVTGGIHTSENIIYVVSWTGSMSQNLDSVLSISGIE